MLAGRFHGQSPCCWAAGEPEPVSLDGKGGPVYALQSLVVEERSEEGDTIIRHHLRRSPPEAATTAGDASISGADRLIGGASADGDTRAGELWAPGWV